VEVYLQAREIEQRLLGRAAGPSAAKAFTENRPVIAAVNRCATQNQVRKR